MNWENFFKEPHVWLDASGPSGDVVVSSRVRLARNLVDVPFPARLNSEGRHVLVEQVLNAARTSATLASARYVDLSLAKKTERQFLMERHLVSSEMVADDQERGVLIGPGQDVTLMIHEEDHLRLQSFSAGLSLREAYAKADRADTELGEQLPFAFDAEWGFCTRCPTNAGTGLRASCLLHLPALAINGDIERVLDGLAQMGVAARGFYGERSKAIGDLFQISNAVSLGHTEMELLETIERVVQSILHYERQGRQSLLEPRRKSATEDQIWRSWGLLLHARLISYDETMSHLSQVRLGLQMGLPLPVKPATLNHLMLVTQPAHLQLLKGSTLKAEERDRWRATLIRKKLQEP
jgi:protein arginine kinase